MKKGHKKTRSKYDNFFKPGQKFGKYSIVSGIVSFKNHYASIEVKCECGTQKFVDAFALCKNNSRQCSDCNNKKSGNLNGRWKGLEEVPGSFFGRIQSSAKKRNLKVNITIEDVWELFLKQNKKCALSDLDISFSDKTVSVDRIDSEKDYIKENIQLVHKDMNLMKNYFNQQYFIEMCPLVSNNCKSIS